MTSLDLEQPATAAAAPAGPLARRPVSALALVVLAVLVVAAGLVVGVRGLLGNPVRSTAADGTSVLAGSFQPVACSGCAAQGYLQDGARSVFVRLPASCAAPARDAHVEVTARPAPDLGKHAYRALGCPAA
ncbi:MAG TPA: hypothetical protein VH134_06515 [Candidatus Dormibacteraeota bacterium]|nr:hypothetical protein [Candidatus Dormibacteraeota bacterium]